MKTLNIFCCLFIGFIIIGCSSPQPQLVCFDYKDLVSIRKEIKANKDNVLPAYEQLIKEADKYLKMNPEKVTDGEMPPSGNAHDFYAIGKYSWPNPDTPDGMPWIRIDCNINPDANGEKFDLARYNNTVKRIKTLSLAWFYSRESQYAEKAAELLRVWFINEDTRMNPHFEFASALPGVYNGMPIGIIFGVTLIEMVDYVKLLTLSDKWSANDDKALQAWFSGYTKWLLESEFGIKEGKANNNHGSWYSAQVAAYSLYTGELEHVKAMAELGKKQIDQQIAPDGGLPRELKRDWAFHYSIYGLHAFSTLALCSDKIGVDLWNYQTDDGRGLELAHRFYLPYLRGEKEWTWGIIKEDEKPHLNAIPLMRWAARKYKSTEFDQITHELISIASNSSRTVWLLGNNDLP